MNNINKDKVLQIDPEYDDDSELIVKPLDIKTKDLSKGINEIYVDHRLKCLWPKKRGGKLEFVLRKTKDDFRSFEILMKS